MKESHDVQILSKNNSNDKVSLCQLHINLKKEKEQKSTGFYLVVRLLTVKEFSERECRKAEKD
jgi:hypothetical protein